MTSAIPRHEKLHLRSSNLIYFSPTIGVRLTLGALVQGMLVRLGGRLSPGCVVHSDRGRRYRTPDWVSGCGAAGIVRSMSRRGHSPDNAAMEAFFGRLKVELFHGRDWSGWTVGRFAGEPGSYISWYNSERLKSFPEGYDTIDDRRTALGLSA